MTPIADTLRKARALVERGWTRGTNARDANGAPVHQLSESATCWCVVGAVARCAIPLGEYLDAIKALHDGGIAPGSVSAWNDAPGRTQAEVVEAFTKAIALAEAQP